MRLRCIEGRYCNPQFTLETGHISPDLTYANANRILTDFPDQFVEASDEEFEEWAGTLEAETAEASEKAAGAVVAAEEERLKNSDESTRKEMIVHLKDKGFSDKQITKFLKDKPVKEEPEEEEAEEEGPEAPESEEAATKPADRQVDEKMKTKRGGNSKAKKKKAAKKRGR